MDEITNLRKKLFRYSLFRDTIFSLKKFLAEEKPQKVIVAYSGGKDSTVLLLITALVLSEITLPLTIVTVDTLVENPLISQHIRNFLEKFRKKTKNLFPCEIKTLKPDLNFSFWVCLIGKGYPLPTPWFRWCQNHLKIKPTRRFLSSLREKTIFLTGHRMEESVERKRTLRRNGVGKNQLYFSFNQTKQHIPLIHWKETDIWKFLSLCNQKEVINLYNSADGSRFGCWVCTLVRKDKTLKSYSRQSSLFKKLLYFKEWMKEYASKTWNRSGFNRNGKFLGPGKGYLTLQARREILKKLTMLQDEVKINLISQSEIKLIKKHWANEQKK